MTLADQLGTTYFQLSTVGVGAVAVGIEDIRQRIFNVLNTMPGTDPFRPLFGSYVYLWNDKPLPKAIPNIKKEIFAALDLWMPEIQIKSITHTVVDLGQVLFNITYLLVDDDLIDQITFSNGNISGGDTSNSIVITALVPAKFTLGIYRVSFTLDGSPAVPAIPAAGFETAADMLTWINTNWTSYGRWYLTENALVLYLNAGVASKASLTVTETAQLTLKTLIPGLSTGLFYDLGFTVDGDAALPEFPTNLNTVEALIIWITNNWSNYGSWYIISEPNTTAIGDYSDDYSDDFDNGNNADALRYLVFQSAEYLTATLNFN